MISSLDDSKSDETWDQNSWMIQGSDQQLGYFFPVHPVFPDPTRENGCPTSAPSSLTKLDYSRCTRWILSGFMIIYY